MEEGGRASKEESIAEIESECVRSQVPLNLVVESLHIDGIFA